MGNYPAKSAQPWRPECALVEFGPAVTLSWYAIAMALAQRKVSVSLDEDLVDAFEQEGRGLSAEVNAAVRTEFELRRRHRLLEEFLDQLDEEHGPVDEALIEKYCSLLG